MKKVIALLVSTTLMQGCVVNVHADEPLHQSQQQLTLSANALQGLQAENGAGQVHIIGDANSSAITVDATLFTREKSKVTLTLERHGNQAVLKALAEENFSYGDSPRIDVVVHMPAHLALQLDDGSGNIELTSLTGKLQIDDGSGDIQINGGAALQLDDGSGNIQVQNIAGDVRIEDGSGNITLKHIGGAVVIDDGSGDLNLQQIAGTVTLDDGSGSIHVDGAAALTVEDDGSGSVHYANIRGEVRLPHDDDDERI